MLSPSGIKKMLLRLERAANKNQAQRSKYYDDPTKWVALVFHVLSLIAIAARFIDSEADLDAAIKALLPLAQVPKVAYPLIIGSGQLEVLIGLLSHENADIALDVIELIHELTDEDVGEEAEDEDEGEEDPEQREAALKSLIDSLVCLPFIYLMPRSHPSSWTTPYWSCWSTICHGLMKRKRQIARGSITFWASLKTLSVPSHH
jgi:beta-catenin-like protein 1